jgi:hypothetical protein
VWSEDHQCFYYTDIPQKEGGFYRLTMDGKITKINLNKLEGPIAELPAEMIPQGIGSFGPCTAKDTFICQLRLGGLAKLTVQKGSD